MRRSDHCTTAWCAQGLGRAWAARFLEQVALGDHLVKARTGTVRGIRNLFERSFGRGHLGGDAAASGWRWGGSPAVSARHSALQALAAFAWAAALLAGRETSVPTSY